MATVVEVDGLWEGDEVMLERYGGCNVLEEHAHPCLRFSHLLPPKAPLVASSTLIRVGPDTSNATEATMITPGINMLT